MIKFNTFITESKNVHMEHLEDNILNGGVEAYHVKHNGSVRKV